MDTIKLFNSLIFMCDIESNVFQTLLLEGTTQITIFLKFNKTER